MALVFRWYLGQLSRWANAGEPERKLDYQVWCGPAMGALNEWTRGSFLETARNRRVVTVALNLLHGAAVTMRVQMLRAQGIALRPRPRARAAIGTGTDRSSRLAVIPLTTKDTKDTKGSKRQGTTGGNVQLGEPRA